ncbi:phosphotransferase [Streptomyces sp. 71268]|uniref:phosphotransferase n=1 Tax=Streptomyces sp. 71268 TaxID=3002640 RepID=UPI0023F7C0FA|nr:phosphotransferase [Streptomyces sp. 71268]WEV25387.1 phosphotransferase [Streptomyces sp. 71268]
MQDRPDLDERAVRQALDAWGMGGAHLTYAPVGFGDYHWVAETGAGRRAFVTVADLTHKDQWGSGPDAAFAGLRAAMEAAVALRAQPGRDFVVAPLTCRDGAAIQRLGPRFAISVFPYESGEAGAFGQELSQDERGEVLDLLATLHRSAVPEPLADLPPESPTGEALRRALAECGRPWHGGPFAEPARELVAGAAAALRERLAAFDGLAAEVAGRGARRVVTHGEPHPGNVLWRAGSGRAGGRPLLVDWDTVRLAHPERDLWLVATGPADLDRYARASGHTPDPSALALYALRWDLGDVAEYLTWFRGPHERTSDTEAGWSGLRETVARLTAGG